MPLTKMCESKLRGRCCSSAPPGYLPDTSRLGSKGHSAERRIYHPGKNSQFRLSSREEMGSPSSASCQPRRDVPGPAEEHQEHWDVLLHCTVPLLPSKACQESPCSEPQARDHLCLTSNSSNYYRTSKYFIYKVV